MLCLYYLMVLVLQDKPQWYHHSLYYVKPTWTNTSCKWPTPLLHVIAILFPRNPIFHLWYVDPLTECTIVTFIWKQWILMKVHFYTFQGKSTSISLYFSLVYITLTQVTSVPSIVHILSSTFTVRRTTLLLLTKNQWLWKIRMPAFVKSN